MKCFKKVAALLFCVALALSVMSVAAFADDEAQLLAGVGKQGNPEFVVTLTPVGNQSGITDRDPNAVEGYEINATQKVDYDLYLAYKHVDGSPYPEFTASSKIDGFQFDYAKGDTDNHNATIQTVTINKEVNSEKLTTPPASVYSDDTLKRYAYTSTDDATQFQMADTDVKVGNANDGIGVKLATLTVEFAEAAQNVAIKPTIKNIMIYVDGMQYIQIPVAYPENNQIAPFEAASGETEPASLTTYREGGGIVNVATGDLTSVTVQPEMPVFVNPVYVATVEHFEANSDTGILQRKYVSEAEYLTYVTYNYTTGNTTATADAATTKPTVSGSTGAAATLTVLKNEDEIPGYTFQGWMVTANTNTSATWAAYSGNWTKLVSYPATTERTGYTMSGVSVWKANATGETDGDTWYNDTRDELASDNKEGVNFIKASNGANTDILAGMVGDITLTPVYTRNVYVATFKAEPAINAPKATFDNSLTVTAATTGENGANGTPAQHTKNYTIENLYANSAIVDYLDVAFDASASDATSDLITTAANQGLMRKGFKFVGWQVSNPDVTYTWTTVKSRVNQNDVVREAQAKHYGDVTFTAEWELDICFAKIDYAYAGSGSLILVGVPADAEKSTNNYEAGYTYKCGNNAMFIIPGATEEDSARRGGYVTKAETATENNQTNSTDYTFTSAYLKGTSGAGTYVLYAYIAASNTPESAITLDETITKDGDATKPGNVTVAYNGNIDDSTDGVNVGDFGNVNSLISAKVANVLPITIHDFVKARLQADVDNNQSDTDFGSIRDVKAIYNKMGYNLT